MTTTRFRSGFTNVRNSQLTLVKPDLKKQCIYASLSFVYISLTSISQPVVMVTIMNEIYAKLTLILAQQRLAANLYYRRQQNNNKCFYMQNEKHSNTSSSRLSHIDLRSSSLIYKQLCYRNFVNTTAASFLDWRPNGAVYPTCIVHPSVIGSL